MDDDVLPLRALRLVAGDGVAPDALDQPALDEPVAPLAVGVGARPGRRSDPCRTAAGPGPCRRPRSGRVALKQCSSSSSMSDELEEHAVDEPEVVAVPQADDLLAATLRIDRAEAGGLLHGGVERCAGWRCARRSPGRRSASAPAGRRHAASSRRRRHARRTGSAGPAAPGWRGGRSRSRRPDGGSRSASRRARRR